VTFDVNGVPGASLRSMPARRRLVRAPDPHPLRQRDRRAWGAASGSGRGSQPRSADRSLHAVL